MTLLIDHLRVRSMYCCKLQYRGELTSAPIIHGKKWRSIHRALNSSCEAAYGVTPLSSSLNWLTTKQNESIISPKISSKKKKKRIHTQRNKAKHSSRTFDWPSQSPPAYYAGDITLIPFLAVRVNPKRISQMRVRLCDLIVVGTLGCVHLHRGRSGRGQAKSNNPPTIRAPIQLPMLTCEYH